MPAPRLFELLRGWNRERLLMGAAGLLGTYLIGVLLRTQLHSLLISLPLAMAGIALALTVFGGALVPVAVLLAGWGLIGTAAPVGWWTWLSRVLPDDAEAGGGLMVAVIQLAIALGATAGGFLLAAHDYIADGHDLDRDEKPAELASYLIMLTTGFAIRAADGSTRRASRARA